jgi:ketosteroid isomerase-like protein
MRKPEFIVAAFALIAVAGPCLAADPKPVVEAERAFARDAGVLGVGRAFQAHIAPDGILFRPEPTNGVAWLEAQESRPPRPGGLNWWPVFAGVSSSDDLGFTTGPWKAGDRGGYYFTIWRKQTDGSWKFALDHGPELAPSPLGPETPVSVLAPANVTPLARAEAMQGMTRADEALDAAAANDLAAAYRSVIADDSRLMGSTTSTQPAVGGAAVRAELALRPGQIRFARLGGDVSAAGDLGYTYGGGDLTGADGAAARVHYVRLWQRRPGGWTLVLDELLPAPPKTAS